MAVFKASSKASQVSEAPGGSTAPKAPKAPKAQKAPKAPKAPKEQKARKAPTEPKAPGRMSAVSGPFGAAFADIRARRYPYALLIAVASFVVVAVTLFVSQVGAPQTTVDNASEAAVTGMTGQIAPAAQEQWFVPLLPWFGIVVLVGAIALFVGVGWSRLVLVVLGIIMVIALAEAAEQIQAIVVAVFTVVGAALSVVLSSHRYLTGTAAAEETTTTETSSGGMIS